MDPTPAVPFAPRGFDALYGLELVLVGSDEVRARVAVRDEVRQPFGLVHGGLYASIAESLASIGTAVEVLKQGLTAMGMSNNTTFLRSITAGTVHATATPLHRGRTTWVWDVEITDDDERLCAMSRVTIAVRPPR
jgi:1,4-dihydroxy-2-naphthoyl-CoA hydrolase